MKHIIVLALAAYSAPAQTGTTGLAGIGGTVVDTQTLKPIPAALVIASRAGAPPFTRNTKTGADGAFQIVGLTPGAYSVCVQAEGEQYLDPCLWSASPAPVTLMSGQSAAGIPVRLAPASVLTVEVKDAQNALRQLTRDGRRPDLSVGVWGPRGLYHPARQSAGPSGGPSDAIATYSYRLAVPRDTALQLAVGSRDLRLGDANGAALPANTSRQAFQHATEDVSPKRFTFSVLGLLP